MLVLLYKWEHSDGNRYFCLTQVSEPRGLRCGHGRCHPGVSTPTAFHEVQVTLKTYGTGLIFIRCYVLVLLYLNLPVG